MYCVFIAQPSVINNVVSLGDTGMKSTEKSSKDTKCFRRSKVKKAGRIQAVRTSVGVEEQDFPLLCYYMGFRDTENSDVFTQDSTSFGEETVVL